MEWLIGARGFPAGKVTQLRGSFSSSKSSFLYYVYGCAMQIGVRDAMEKLLGEDFMKFTTEANIVAKFLFYGLRHADNATALFLERAKALNRELRFDDCDLADTLTCAIKRTAKRNVVSDIDAGKVLALINDGKTAKCAFAEGSGIGIPSDITFLDEAAKEICKRIWLLRYAWIAHIETEGAPNSADYVAKFGCNPMLFLHIKANDLNDMFKRIDTFDMALHGGREGTVNPETGRLVKSKFSKEDALDPEMTKPTIIGIDSLSNVGSDAGEDFVDLEKSERPGGDSKDVRRFFRAREQDYDKHQVTLFVTTHETTEIKTGMGAGYGGPKSTARNQKALGMALTIAIDTLDVEWKGGKEGKEVLGSKQYLKTFKSKIAPRNRKIVLFRKELGGYDMAETDLQFFLGDPKNNNCKDNPFLPGGFLCPEGAKCGITKVRGGWSAPMVSDKVFKTADEFIKELYSDAERLRKIREHLRIRGFGFEFETKYDIQDDFGAYDDNADQVVDDENDEEKGSDEI